MVTYESAISGTTISGYSVHAQKLTTSTDLQCRSLCKREFVNLSDFLGAQRNDPIRPSYAERAVIDPPRTGATYILHLSGLVYLGNGMAFNTKRKYLHDLYLWQDLRPSDNIWLSIRCYVNVSFEISLNLISFIVKMKRFMVVFQKKIRVERILENNKSEIISECVGTGF